MKTFIKLLLEGLLLSLVYIFSIEKDGTFNDVVVFSILFAFGCVFASIFNISPDIIVGAFITKIIVNFMDKL